MPMRRNDIPTPVDAAVSARGQPALPDLLLAFSVAAVVLALRAPDALTLPQFWAEDGAKFFVQQYGHALPPLFQPVAGYLHATARLVAWFASLFPSVHAPLIYNLATIAVGAAAVAALRRLPMAPAAFWAALAALALTPTNVEVFGTLTNAQWVLQLYLLLPMARFVTGEPAKNPWAACLLAAFVGLSGPFSLFAVAGALAGRGYLAVATRRLASLREMTRDHPEMVVLAACALIQLGFTLLTPDTHGARAKLLPGWFAIRDVLAASQTHTLGYAALPHALFCLLTVAALAGAWYGAATAPQRAVVVAVACFVAIQLWTVAGKHAALPGPILELRYGDRYFVLFKITFWTVLVLALRALLGRQRKLALPLILLLLGGFAVVNSDNLRRTPLADLDWREHALRMDRGEAVEAPINPGGGWKVAVPARTP